jgi:mitochondrial fission protein ELM1
MSKPLTAWLLGNGAAGAENQCLGLLEALRVSKFDLVRPPLSLWNRLPTPVHAAALRVAGLAGAGWRAGIPGCAADDFPDLIVGSGRAVSALSTCLRRASRGRSFSIHIQHPHCSVALFDAVILPRHDAHLLSTLGNSFGSGGCARRAPGNVIVTTGALNRIRPSSLPHDASAVFAVGGSSRHIRLSPSGLADVVQQLIRCAAHT